MTTLDALKKTVEILENFEPLYETDRISLVQVVAGRLGNEQVHEVAALDTHRNLVLRVIIRPDSEPQVQHGLPLRPNTEGGK